MINREEFIHLAAQTYDDLDQRRLGLAYDWLIKHHAHVMRDSGEPYASHPLAVAQILLKVGVDEDVLIAGLLHDLVEDTEVTLDDIRLEFGPAVARLVDGVTKLSDLELGRDQIDKKDLNLRKLVTSIATDMRVLTIKLADRLHNMRTLHHKKKVTSRRNTAQETLDVFMSMADMAGFARWRDELGELAIKELHPAEHEAIIRITSLLQQQSALLIDYIIKLIQDIMAKEAIEADVSGRMKSVFSIWTKTLRKHQQPKELCDIFGFRIIVSDEAACYRALGALHSRYRCIPHEFDDYISNPKANGYRSLHSVLHFQIAEKSGLSLPWRKVKRAAEQVAIANPPNPLPYSEKAISHSSSALVLRIEVQIRTQSMHELAEFGDAAHGQYKSKQLFTTSHHQTDDRVQEARVSLLQAVLRNLADPSHKGGNTLQSVRENTGDYIYAFTPMGKIIYLPKGASLLDFAYAVHIQVGNHSAGALLDGRPATLNTRLMENGQMVEVITADDPQVDWRWSAWVITPLAKRSINQLVTAQERQRRIAEAKLALTTLFQNEDCELKLDQLAKLGRHLGFEGASGDDILNYVGRWLYASHQGEPVEKLTREHKFIAPRDVLYAMYPHHKSTAVLQNVTIRPAATGLSRGLLSIKVAHPAITAEAAVFHFSRCCSPLPGERILGFLTTASQISVHRVNCRAVDNLANFGDRWVELAWDPKAGDKAKYIVRLHTVMVNKPGVLHTVTGIIAAEQSNIADLHFRQRYNDSFVADIDMEVRDAQHFYRIQQALNRIEEISSTERL